MLRTAFIERSTACSLLAVGEAVVAESGLMVGKVQMDPKRARLSADLDLSHCDGGGFAGCADGELHSIPAST